MSKWYVKMPDFIEIEDYDPRWSGLFEEEKRRIEQALNDGNVVAIEHYGSTAVPGLPAKPVIDILVTVRWFAEARSAYEVALKPMQYVYWNEDPKAGSRMFFVKGMPPHGEKRTHHIHIVQHDNMEFMDRLRFRNYLRGHALIAGNYGRLKRKLAEQYKEDREGYTAAKSGFIETVMMKIRMGTA